ncbi:hypothetical protein HWB52_gp45 [Pseudomonas phage Littlefix]|uniref:Uncharacterized protein n=1 Tax=Pseudomonas phage Littlefix TaxID=2079289 RepID=A0A2K9VHQ9_9CAUD|nr:hypothetical protein HWB52_gp45 [Pseudomonas phage Littlefix]AUV61860.1 hypothetical protein PsPhLittlefix_gp45 [Pseudomonas phage Littlefix]
MAINNKALQIIKNNTHLPPSILQNVLQAQGQIVPLGQISEIIEAIKEHDQVHTVTSPKGLKVNISDMDTILQYALAGGMPRELLRK